MWMNHHRLFRIIKRSDDGLMVLNALFLLFVTFVPFPTVVFAEYMQTSHALTAALFYNGTFVTLAICFNALWWYVRTGDRLVDSVSDKAQIHAITKQYAVGPVLYGVCTAIAVANVYASLAANLLLAMYFAIPSATIRRIVGR